MTAPILRKWGGIRWRLLQHPRQVHALPLQLQAREVEAGDVEELVDEVLQPLRLLQGDAGVPGPDLRGDLRLIPQEGQVADDAGQGRFQVVGQIDD